MVQAHSCSPQLLWLCAQIKDCLYCWKKRGEAVFQDHPHIHQRQKPASKM